MTGWGHLVSALRPLLAAAAAVCCVGGTSTGRELACVPPERICCAVPPQTEDHSAPLRLGFQLWPEDIAQRALAVQAMRPSWFRYSGGPSWRRAARLPSNATYDQTLAYVRAAFEADAARYRDQALRAAALAVQSKAQTHFIVWEPPVTDAEDPVPETDKRDRRLVDGALDGTARFYVALFVVLREFGYPIDAVELSNEPDGGWNMKIAPARFVQLLRQVRAEARAAGVPLPKIAGPGTSTIAAFGDYLKEDAGARALLGLLDVLSTHAWDDRSNRDAVEEAARVRQRLHALGDDRSVAVTEFALTFLAPDDRTLGHGAQFRSGQAVSGQPLYAARTVAMALSLSHVGFSPIIFWEFQDQAWGRSSYGLRDLGGEARPTSWIWSALSRLGHERPGLVVTPAANGRVYVMADRSEWAGYVLTNRGTESEEIAFGTDRIGDALRRRTENPIMVTLCDRATPLPGVRLAPGEIRLLPGRIAAEGSPR